MPLIRAHASWDVSKPYVILSAAKDLKFCILRSFAVFAAQDDALSVYSFAIGRATYVWFLGIAAAVVAYVAWNDPLRYAAMRLQPLGAAAVFVAACIGFGWAVRAPDLLTAAALGFGVVGALCFFAALLHLLHPATLIALVGFGIVLFALAVRGSRFAFRGSPGWVIIAVVIALVLPFVVAPDVSTDSLEYHLLVPKIIIQQNAIRYQPLLVESNYPSLGEYDFLPLLVLGDDRTAKSFHFLCAMLLLWALGRLSRLIAAESDGVLAAALFLSMPVVALTAGWAWNDMLFTLFVILSLVHLIGRRFLLAGVLFGFATWTKYTFVLAGIGIAAILVRGLLQRWWRTRDIVRFAVPVALIASIWMIKNAVLTGNPVYPFLNGLFHSPFWSAASDRYFRETLTRYEIPEWHWWSYLAFPFLLTLKPRVIDVQTGILPLVLLPLLFFPKRQQAAALLKTYVVAIVLGWLLIRTEARSLLSLLAVLSAVYAANIERLRGWRAVVGVGVALNVVIMLVTTHVVSDPARYFLGVETREQYIARMDPKQGAYRWIDSQPEARAVLLVGLHDPFYLQKPALFSSCCDTPVAQDLTARHGSSIAGVLKAQGITHVALRAREYERENGAGLYSWSAAQRATFESFLRDRCRPVARVGEVLILRLM